MRRLSIVLGLLGSLAFGAALVVPPMMVMTMSGAGDEGGSDAQPIACETDLPPGNPVVLTDQRQRDNAKAIIQVGQELKIPTRGLIVAIATAMQESTLFNLASAANPASLDYPHDKTAAGDHDSVGLFQQRNAWGSMQERMTPATSARLFFTGGHAGQRGLLDIPGWQSMSIAGAAQAVQVSAFPFAYARWESLATTTVQQAASAPVPCAPDEDRAGLPDGAVGKMLTAALAQQGDPYVWGATGPDSFDCSGLVLWSWGEAGYRLKIRTAAQMWQKSDAVRPGAEQPGDLLFGHFDSTGAHHVEIVVRRGLVVEAPSTGDVVKTRHYEVKEGQRLGRLKPETMQKVG